MNADRQKKGKPGCKPLADRIRKAILFGPVYSVPPKGATLRNVKRGSGRADKAA